MKVEQFEDKNLSHYSYAVLSDSREIVLVDPARDPQPYYDYADEHEAKIIGVIETHPHADFVSSHLQIQQETGAKLFVSKLLKAEYSFIAFDEGAVSSTVVFSTALAFTSLVSCLVEQIMESAHAPPR